MNLDAAWFADGVSASCREVKRKIRKKMLIRLFLAALEPPKLLETEGGAVCYTAGINAVEEEPETKAAVCQLLINFKPQLWLIKRAKWRLNSCNKKQMLAWFISPEANLLFKKYLKNFLAKFC